MARQAQCSCCPGQFSRLQGENLCSTHCRLDLLNRRNRESLPLPATDESSEGLTSDIGRCDVGGTRDRLQQTNTKDLDVS